MEHLERLQHIPPFALRTRSAPTTYRFTPDPPVGGWALATVNDATGELSIQSDWGTWAYRWHTAHLGPGRQSGDGVATLTEFLSCRSPDSCHYIADKLTSAEHCLRWAFSAEKTLKYLKERVREDAQLSESSITELLAELDELPTTDDSRDFVDAFYQIDDHDKIVCDSPGEWIREELTGSYLVLLHRIIPALVEACNQTMIERALAPGTNCRPRVHAVLTEHEMTCKRCGTTTPRVAGSKSVMAFLAKHRDCPIDGEKPTWVWSDNEEAWNMPARFWSREEAIGEVNGNAAASAGMEPGQKFWTARAVPITAAIAAEGVPDTARILEYIDDYLYDNYGLEDGVGTATPEAQLQLDEEIQALVARWLHRVDAVPSWYRVEDVQSHVFEPTESTSEPEATSEPTPEATP